MSIREDFAELVTGRAPALEAIHLKNGSEEVQPLVVVVMLSLNTLLGKGLPGMLAAYDLVQVCQGKNYTPSHGNMQMLQDHQLLQADGKPHSSVRNIILSAVQGEGLGMSFGSPVAEVALVSARTSSSPKAPGG